MPEAPELHLAARYINTVCEGLIFSGSVEKSEVSKNPEVSFNSQGYTISATSRGKEVKLSLTPIKVEESHVKGKVQKDGGTGKENSPMDIVFRFGMSGCFTLTPVDEMPKHGHLRFYTNEKPRRVLCFVDVRRFGSWMAPGIWQSNCGPCVMLEYEKFRENVIKNLQAKAFDKPICETLLNQKYFNGIGNYLRAEILFRLKIPPFVKARTVLEPLEYTDELSLSEKLKLKKENPDLLDLCNLLPFEVVDLEEKKGNDSKLSDNYAGLQKWVQCYYVPGMKTLLDSNKRAIWFQGDPGPMAPKGAKTNRKRVFLVKTDPDAASVSESMSKRKKTGVMNPKSVNKASHRENTRTRESTKKLSSSASRREGKKAPQSRGKGQQPRSRAKISAVKSSPRATSLVKGRRGQKLSKKGDHNINVSVNSKEKGSTRKVKKEEQPASFAKTPLKKSQHEKITTEKKEVLSPPPGGSLKSTLTAKGRNQRPSAQKSAGSPRGTGRNPRRVKAM